MSDQGKYRLLTRSDFDGLVCAILLKELGMLGDIKFVHPKDVQDGLIEITDRDILTNLPYVDGCHLCFDHHDSEEIRSDGDTPENHILLSDAASAARVVYNYYGGFQRFPMIGEDMMIGVDKADSAQFDREDILNPQGWVLLSFLMDPRTGLGRFREFRVSNYQLMMDLIDYCRDHSIEEILDLEDVRERVELYEAHSAKAIEQIRGSSEVHGNLVILNLQDQEVIHPTNRFMIYALYPECDISIHRLWGLKQQNTVFAIGKSILDRGCRTNVGELAFKYGGGGHEAAGTCQISNEDAERVKEELIAKINSDAGIIPATT